MLASMKYTPSLHNAAIQISNPNPLLLRVHGCGFWVQFHDGWLKTAVRFTNMCWIG